MGNSSSSSKKVVACKHALSKAEEEDDRFASFQASTISLVARGRNSNATMLVTVDGNLGGSSGGDASARAGIAAIMARARSSAGGEQKFTRSSAGQGRRRDATSTQQDSDGQVQKPRVPRDPPLTT